MAYFLLSPQKIWSCLGIAGSSHLFKHPYGYAYFNQKSGDTILVIILPRPSAFSWN